jgi:hypothetical protein
MRNELNEIERIDKYLLNELSNADKKEFEMNLLLDSSLFDRTERQKLVHRIIRLFNRSYQRKRFEKIYFLLMQQADFKKNIESIFV